MLELRDLPAGARLDQTNPRLGRVLLTQVHDEEIARAKAELTVLGPGQL